MTTAELFSRHLFMCGGLRANIIGFLDKSHTAAALANAHEWNEAFNKALAMPQQGRDAEIWDNKRIKVEPREGWDESKQRSAPS